VVKGGLGWVRRRAYRSEIVSCGAVDVMSSSDSSESGWKMRISLFFSYKVGAKILGRYACEECIYLCL